MSRRMGYTLVELLVVICVIGLLMGVLVPVLADVGVSSRRIQGQANLRTMTLAARSWAMEHDGALPPALLIGTDEDSTSGDVRCWDWWTRTNDSSFVRPGLLWTYTDHPGTVLQCPAYAGEDNWQGQDRPSGYNYNVTFIAAMSPLQGVAGQGCWDLLVAKPALAEEGEPPVAVDLALSQCRRSGQVALFGEGGYRDGANKFMRSPLHELEVAYAGAQAFRHGGMSNVGFIDGHVETVRNPRLGLHHEQLPEGMTTLLDHPRNGFLSDDDSAYDPR